VSFLLIIIFKNKKSLFMENLASLLESDVGFVVDGETLAAHRLIVAAGSPVLAAILKKMAKKKLQR